MGHNRNDGHNSKLPVFTQPNIGLDSEVRLAVVDLLNTILSDEAVLAVKTYSAHWHVSGAGFQELRDLFDQQARQLMAIWVEIAERVRILGGFPVCGFMDFLHATRIEDQSGIVPDILRLLADQEAFVRFLREDARKCAQEYEDEGTNDLLIRVMCLHEKMAWMLRSHLETEPARGDTQQPDHR